MNQPILPGGTLGVLGGGQLGRMFAIEARRLGYRVHVLADKADSPAGQVSDREYVGAYDDVDALRELADSVDALTFEFENISAAAVREACADVITRPNVELLFTTQNRIREKRAIQEAEVATVNFVAVETEDDMKEAATKIGAPSIMKTAAFGYDGKGQCRIDDARFMPEAWEALGRTPVVVEALADFEREISVLAVRGANGECAIYEPLDNDHANHILDISTYPSTVDQDIRDRAKIIAQKLVEAWNVVGVICVEMFVLRDGQIVVNEIAPRPHNSGHLTIEAQGGGQFGQQVRALCGLPLLATDSLRPAAMANILGDIWEHGEPNWTRALQYPVHIHLYGKEAAKPGRKMGHITAVANSTKEAREAVCSARAALITP